jgi:hypothetical protein
MSLSGKANILVSAFSIFTGAKSFEKNPVIGNEYLNKKGLHLFRMKAAHRVASLHRLLLKNRVPMQYRRQYDKQGYICIENYLPQGTYEELKQQILTSDWDRLDMNQGGIITRRVLLDAANLPSPLNDLQRIIQSRALKDLIRYVAGTGGEPIYSLQAIFAGHARRNSDPQGNFHSDAFHSTAKAWLFLEDVPKDQGPFAYIPGSHQLTPKRLDWEYEQSCKAANHPIRYHARGSFRAAADDLSRMDYGEPTVFSVPANTLVIANTMGFHRRTPSPAATVRVELYATLRRNPFHLFPQLDLLSLPVLRNRVGSIYWWAMVWANRVIGTKLPWKSAGCGSLKEQPVRLKKRRP